VATLSLENKKEGPTERRGLRMLGCDRGRSARPPRKTTPASEAASARANASGPSNEVASATKTRYNFLNPTKRKPNVDPDRVPLYSPIVRMTLFSGRVLLDDSRFWLLTIWSYCGIVVNSPFGTMCTILYPPALSWCKISGNASAVLC